MNAEALLEEARALVHRPDEATAGLWPRAAAFLGRQALEEGVDEFWRRRAPGVEQCPSRAKLLCLQGYLRDQAVATAAMQAWATLSAACHHHPYDLLPTAGELNHWLDLVAELLQELEA